MITIPDARFEAYKASCDFIQKYIFPGGQLLSVGSIVAAMNGLIPEGSTDGASAFSDRTFTTTAPTSNATASKSMQFRLRSATDFAPDYADTLALWNRRFVRNFVPERFPDHFSRPADFAVVKRKWIYYFRYCQAAFALNYLGLYQMSVSRTLEHVK